MVDLNVPSDGGPGLLIAALAAGGAALAAGGDDDEEIDLRGEKEAKLQAFEDSMAQHFADEPTVTERGYGEYIVEGHLVVAPDDDFASSFTFDANNDAVRDVTLRFGDFLTDEYEMDRLRRGFNEILDRANAPGAGWSAYPQGDVGTGPHITVLGGATRLDPAKVIAFVGRVLDEYHREFGAAASPGDDYHPGVQTIIDVADEIGSVGQVGEERIVGGARQRTIDFSTGEDGTDRFAEFASGQFGGSVSVDTTTGEVRRATVRFGEVDIEDESDRFVTLNQLHGKADPPSEEIVVDSGDFEQGMIHVRYYGSDVGETLDPDAFANYLRRFDRQVEENQDRLR